MVQPIELSKGPARLVSYDESRDAQTVAWLNDPAVYEEFGLTHSVTLESHHALFPSSVVRVTYTF